MHEVQVQEVIAQVVAAKDVIAQVVVARVGLLLVGDLQEVQELVPPAQAHQTGMRDKPVRQAEPAPAQTAPAQAFQIAMRLQRAWT